MQVAFVVPRFHPYQGGYENHILSLAEHLARANNKVSVFTTTASDLESFWLDGFRTFPTGKETYRSIEVHRFQISYDRWSRRASRLISLLPDWRLKAKYSRPGFAVIGLTKALRAARPDLIHVGPLPYNSLMYTGISEARRLGIPVIATPCTHFGEEQNDEVSRFYVQPFQIKMLDSCDIVLTLTKTEAGRLMDLGVSRTKLRVSGAGIDVQKVTGGDSVRIRTKYNLNGPIVLHLGMMAPDKGSVCVVEAMKILWKQGMEVHLVLAGPVLSAFNEYVRQQIPHSPKLMNLGPVEERDKVDLLAAADVVVQPSRVESLGLVLLEAWANEKPVIAANIAVSREIVEPGKDGMLVRFGDSNDLAQNISALLQNPETGRLMGANGKAKVLRVYSLTNVLHAIEPVFSTKPPVQP